MSKSWTGPKEKMYLVLAYILKVQSNARHAVRMWDVQAHSTTCSCMWSTFDTTNKWTNDIRSNMLVNVTIEKSRASPTARISDDWVSAGNVRSNASATASTGASGAEGGDIREVGIGLAWTPVSVVQACICKPTSRCSTVIVCTAPSLTGGGDRYGGSVTCSDPSRSGKRSQNVDSSSCSNSVLLVRLPSDGYQTDAVVWNQNNNNNFVNNRMTCEYL